METKSKERAHFEKFCCEKYQCSANSLVLNREKFEKIKRFLKDRSTPEFIGEARFRYWVCKEKKFVILNIPSCGLDNALCVPTDVKNSRRSPGHGTLQVAYLEQFYDLIKWAHENSGHGGVVKTEDAVNCRYAGIPRSAVRQYVRMCTVCNLRNNPQECNTIDASCHEPCEDTQSDHSTFLNVTEELVLNRCEDINCGCGKVHCPFCNVEHYKPSRPARVRDHLNKLHFKHAVCYDEKYIIKCFFDCNVPAGHYHCPYCPSQLLKRTAYTRHLKKHVQKLGKDVNLVHAPDFKQPDTIRFDGHEINLCTEICEDALGKHYHCPMCSVKNFTEMGPMVDHLWRCREIKNLESQQTHLNKLCMNKQETDPWQKSQTCTVPHPREIEDLKWHISIVRSVADLPLERCQLDNCCRNRYHCPLCLTDKFKPSYLSHMKEHYLSHWNSRVKLKDYNVLVCYCPCEKEKGVSHVRFHYHCPVCGETRRRKQGFIKHVQLCGDGKRWKQDIMKLNASLLTNIQDDGSDNIYGEENDEDGPDILSGNLEDDTGKDTGVTDDEEVLVTPKPETDVCQNEVETSKPVTNEIISENEVFDTVTAVVSKRVTETVKTESALKSLFDNITGLTGVKWIWSPGTVKVVYAMSGNWDSVGKARNLLKEFCEKNSGDKLELSAEYFTEKSGTAGDQPEVHPRDEENDMTVSPDIFHNKMGQSKSDGFPQSVMISSSTGDAVAALCSIGMSGSIDHNQSHMETEKSFTRPVHSLVQIRQSEEVRESATEVNQPMGNADVIPTQTKLSNFMAAATATKMVQTEENIKESYISEAKASTPTIRKGGKRVGSSLEKPSKKSCNPALRQTLRRSTKIPDQCAETPGKTGLRRQLPKSTDPPSSENRRYSTRGLKMDFSLLNSGKKRKPTEECSNHTKAAQKKSNANKKLRLDQSRSFTPNISDRMVTRNSLKANMSSDPAGKTPGKIPKEKGIVCCEDSNLDRTTETCIDEDDDSGMVDTADPLESDSDNSENNKTQKHCLKTQTLQPIASIPVVTYSMQSSGISRRFWGESGEPKPKQPNTKNSLQFRETAIKPSTVYTCSLSACPFFSTDFTALTDHYKSEHTSINIFTCDRCEEIFSSVQDRVKHVDSCHGPHIQDRPETALKILHFCSKCCFQSDSFSAVTNHMIRDHNILDPPRCDVCEKKFSKSMFKNVHLSMTHGPKAVTGNGRLASEKEKTSCSLCAHTAESFSDLTSHLIKTHEILDPLRCDVCERIFDKIWDKSHHAAKRHGPQNKMGDLCCDVCGKFCDSDHALNWHRSYAHKLSNKVDFSTEPLTCKRCDFQCYSYFQMKNHKSDHKHSPQTCHICDKTFARSTHLLTHMQALHTKTRSCVCEICGKKFNHIRYLASHMKRHTGEKKHACSICGWRFYETNTLRDHMETHKPASDRKYRYICSYCGSRYTSKANFTDHLNKHTGEKPYKCQLCDRKFGFRSQLIKHKIFVHSNDKPFQCRWCDKAFKLKQKLEQHEVCHTGESRHTCEKCKKPFSCRATLKQHLPRCRGENSWNKSQRKTPATNMPSSSAGSRSVLQGEYTKSGNSSFPNSIIIEMENGQRTVVDIQQLETAVSQIEQTSVNASSEIYLCSVCNADFQNLEDAELHISTVHMESEELGNSSEMQVPETEKSVTSLISALETIETPTTSLTQEQN